MPWKTGKHGDHTGRTIRSPKSLARREGILVKKFRQTTGTSEEILTETIYSLGKQNRWLMPEVIKASVNPLDDVGEEEHFVLVEQRMDEGRSTRNCRRERCISVYDSSTRKVRKPRGKYSQTRCLMSESWKTDLEFEVHYPNIKGSWPFNSEVKISQKRRGNRKSSSKNRRGKLSMMVEEEDGYCIDEGEKYYDEEENFGGEMEKGRAVRLEEYLDQGKRAQRKYYTAKSNCKEEKGSCINNIIVVDDKELVNEHKRLLARARKTDSLMSEYLRSARQKVAKRNKSKISKVFLENVGNQNQICKKEIIFDSSKMNENSKEESFDFISEVYPTCKVCLQEAEICPSELRQNWGESYREGSCFPRRFAIDLSRLVNSSLEHVDLAVMVVLFELNPQEKSTSSFCKASVTLVIDHGLAALNTSLQTHEMIKNDFLDLLHGNGLYIISTVKDIVDTGVKCITKYETPPMPTKTCNVKKVFCTSEVFTEVLGWKGKSHPEKEALKKTKKMLERENELDPKHFFGSSLPERECGICFEDLKDEDGQNCTTLLPCKHSFCNSCWQVYIKRMLKMGETNLLCPSYQCHISLDSITVMSLATSWYGRYFSWKIKKNLDNNPTMKHCPSEGCHLVMQIVPCHEGIHKTISDPLPVMCACNQLWCFKCQEPAHWPAKCEQAEIYRKTYRCKPWKKEITSVMVKKCPNCRYPIEKYYGCDNMYCIMCSVYFCWQCLQITKGHHDLGVCHNRKIFSSEILLSEVSKTKTQTLTQMAWSSYLARKTTKILAVKRKLKSMEQGFKAYSFLRASALKKLDCSRMSSFLEGMIEHNALQQVRDAFNFKLQFHVVIEGVAIILLTETKHCSRSLQNDLTRLVFIVERLENLFHSSSFGSKEVATKLKGFVERGKMCIGDIKKHVMN